MAPSNILFSLMYVVSFFIVIESSDWVLVWIGLEVNMMSFVALIYKMGCMSNSESCIKYFFIQSLGSALLLSMFYFSGNYFSYWAGLILSYKLGAGIFFYWFPSICSGLGWMSCLILMSIQKFIPLLLISMMISWVVWIILLTSLLLGAWGSMNQIKMKRLMAFSSIHHIGWMMMCMIIDSSLWIFYLIVYVIMIYPIVKVFNKLDSNSMLEVNHWEDQSSIVFSMLSMAGMPPFLGFFLKWVVFSNIMWFHVGILFILIVMSTSMFYIYFRFIYNMCMKYGYGYSWELLGDKRYFYDYNLVNILGINFIVIMMVYTFM